MPDSAEPVERRVLERLDVRAVTRWAALVRSAFATYRSEIDSLNVFPVPDGDTGTNLYLTFDGALDGARSAFERSMVTEPLTLASLCREVSRAMLLSARGNSGVILSQAFQGLAQYVAASGVTDLDGPGLAGALAQADALAWACVAQPKEGTILSVSHAAATCAQEVVAADASASLLEVSQAALATARKALSRTTEQLPALQAAGVVDAGGAGYVLLLEALVEVVSGQPDGGEQDPLGRRSGWVTTPSVTTAASSQPARVPTPAVAPAYEVMYLLSESDDDRVQQLRAALEPLGDSLLVVGGDGQWNVHVHVNDVGAAIEAGIEAGRPRRISVTAFGDTAGPRADPGAQAVAACAAGPGLADVMRAAGATVVRSGPAQRAAAGELLAAVRSCHAGTVILLPNDSDTELAAQAAADAAAQDGIRVRVVRSRTAVQGLAALAVFDPAAELEDNVVAMSRAAAATRHGGVTVALKEALTSAGHCRPGDVLGIVDGDFALIGSDLFAVSEAVLDRLLAAGGELLTVVIGQGAPPGLAAAVQAAARRRRRDVEVTEIDGGQPLYPLLLGVE